jgi:hypothetical protein
MVPGNLKAVFTASFNPIEVYLLLLIFVNFLKTNNIKKKN